MFKTILPFISPLFSREWSVLQIILPESCKRIIPNLQPMTAATQLHLPSLEDVRGKYIALNLTDQERQNCYTIPCPRPNQQ